MINSILLFGYHMMYDVCLNGEHHYVYALPYYDDVCTGRLLYPDGMKFYIVSDKVYIESILAKSKDNQMQQHYFEEFVDPLLLDGKYKNFRYIGDSHEFIGSISSSVMQAVCRYLLECNKS